MYVEARIRLQSSENENHWIEDVCLIERNLLEVDQHSVDVN